MMWRRENHLIASHSQTGARFHRFAHAFFTFGNERGCVKRELRPEELRQLVYICNLYYIQGLSQHEISKKMFVSRPQISKLLAKARKHNIVSIHINDPFSREHEVGDALVKKYHLDNAVVVDVGEKSYEEALALVAKTSSLIVTSHIANGQTIGIAAGLTVAACSEHLNMYNCTDLMFVPLIGGQSFEGESWYANNNCQRFATRMQERYMVLNSPMVVRNEHARRELQGDDSIHPVLDRYNHLDVILLGVGQVEKDATLGKCPIGLEEIDWCRERGAKAIIGASFIDAGGNETLHEKSDLFVGIKGQQILQCKKVITFVVGRKKIEAVEAVLKGGFVNTLCIDMDTAKILVE